jgi:3-methyladenine DNA glycosylase/8-oxoguanine DNA glycosylase
MGEGVRPRRRELTWKAELRLVGAGGEPVDLWRTISSHGVADLPPNRIDEEARTLELTLRVSKGKPRTVGVAQGPPGRASITVVGPAPAPELAQALLERIGHLLRLDEDLSDFYARVQDDPDLAWAGAGAGRLLRSATVFEDVVKTIATTNCAWGATVRMVGALVEHLGEPAAGASLDGPYGRAFPSPAAMAEAGDDFYKNVVRAGYRGPYFRSLAESVASDELDLEELAEASADELPDEEVAARLLALPGVGPYATAHIMMLLGRYTPLILDSWTRPKYARVNGRKASDKTIERRFRRYGRYAGLAFWLYLTRDWVDD